MPRVFITTFGGRSTVQAESYMGSAWRAMSAALATHNYRWNLKRGPDSRNIGPCEALPGLVKDLGDHKIEVTLDDESRRVLSAAAQSGLTTPELQAKAVIEVREAEMAKRGLSLWKPFQQDGAIFLSSREHALIGDEMGTGKTIQMLAALQEDAPVLVVCPATAMVNWAMECRKWRPEFRVFLAMKSANRRTIERLEDRQITVFRDASWPLPGTIWIVNYESMPCSTSIYKKEWRENEQTGLSEEVDVLWIEKTLETPPHKNTVLIGDEIHRVKNRNAKMTKKWSTLRDSVKACGGKIWGASGTPIYNRPPDLANVLKALSCFSDVFTGWTDFVRRMGGTKQGLGTDWSGKVDPSVPVSMRRVMIRREKKHVMKDLPEKTYKEILVEPTPELIQICEEITQKLRVRGIDLRKLLEVVKDETESQKEERLKRITGSIPFEDMSRLHSVCSEIGYQGALETIEEYEEAEEPLVVFSPHRGQVEALGQRPGWTTILGGDNLGERSQKIADFQAGKYKGVALTISAGKEAITLTRSSSVLFCMLSWSPSENRQAEDRIHRGGQTRGCLVTWMVPDHYFVVRLMELIGWKESIHTSAISAASLVDSLASERRYAAEQALLVADRDSMAAKVLPTATVDVRALLAAIPEGRYALDSAESPVHTVFWLLDKPAEGRWTGWAFLKVQMGPSAGRFSSIRPDCRATPAAAAVLERLAKDPYAASVRYGQELGMCGVCGSPLTNEESRAKGIGPICEAKFGGAS